MAKRKKQTGSGNINRKSGNNVFPKRVPIPSEVYQHVKKEMWFLSLDELKNELGVSKRVARALRNGVQITISNNYLLILKSIIGLDRRYGLKARIRWATEEARDRTRFVELNRFLAKIIAELPKDVAKMIAGGWITRHANLMSGISIWEDQLFVLQLLADLKRWYTMVHERYPEFDSVLFDGTGLFKDKPVVQMENSSNEQNLPPIRKTRRKKSSSRKSFISANKKALDMANSMLRQFPPRSLFREQSK